MSKELEQNIVEIEKQLAEMKAELEKSKKFEWKYPYNKAYILSKGEVLSSFTGNNKCTMKEGRYRLSKQYAEHSLERNRVANRLEALVDQIEPDYVVPEISNRAYRIALLSGGQYNVSWDGSLRNIGCIYMSKATAAKICELLNSGEVVL